EPTEYSQGIPQLLRLLNGPLLNAGASVIDRLCDEGASTEEAITALYLTALSRRPTAAEVKLMSGYLARRKGAREGYAGVLWAWLNSSEFARNHWALRGHHQNRPRFAGARRAPAKRPGEILMTNLFGDVSRREALRLAAAGVAGASLSGWLGVLADRAAR